MRWLLTTPAEIDPEQVRREVEAAGGKLETREPIPLDPGDQVLYAEGPDDLDARLQGSQLPIKVNPESEPEPYGGTGPQAF